MGKGRTVTIAAMVTTLAVFLPPTSTSVAQSNSSGITEKERQCRAKVPRYCDGMAGPSNGRYYASSYNDCASKEYALCRRLYAPVSEANKCRNIRGYCEQVAARRAKGSRSYRQMYSRHYISCFRRTDATCNRRRR